MPPYKTLEKIGTLQIVIDAISGKNIEIAGVFSEIPTDSSIDVINEIVKRYKDLNCEGILALGGGSVIDTAKGTRMVLAQEKENKAKKSQNPAKELSNLLTFRKRNAYA